MRFAADLHVFPGGRLDPGDADHAAAAVRETREETGIELNPASLISLSRWVTPPGLPSRYDARFFAALVDPDTEVSVRSEEVADWRWLEPADALEALALREIAMWQPTMVTLQQLVGCKDERSIRAAFPHGKAGAAPVFGRINAAVVAVKQPWAGGVEGRTATGWIVGQREWVVVNPADPTGITTDAIIEQATRAGARVTAIAITDLDPIRHAGVEMFAAGLALPVVAGVGTARIAPYPVTELADGAEVPFGDVRLLVRGSGQRPWGAERVRYVGLDWMVPPG